MGGSRVGKDEAGNLAAAMGKRSQLRKIAELPAVAGSVGMHGQQHSDEFSTKVCMISENSLYLAIR